MLLTCAAFAQSHQYVTTPFAKLRSMASFQARVDSVIYWDQKEIKVADKPEVWVYVSQTNGTRLILVWQEATTQHVAFARSLQVSNSYRFPEVWDEFVAPKKKN